MTANNPNPPVVGIAYSFSHVPSPGCSCEACDTSNAKAKSVGSKRSSRRLSEQEGK